MFALAVRLWQIDLTQFEDDQAVLLGGAVHFVSSHQLPLTSGLSFTVGVRHPPLVTFLLTIPALVSHNPAVASGFVALCDAVAAVLVYVVAGRLSSRSAAVSAGALYAVMPAAVVFGRRIWNPDFVPLFSAAALLALVHFWQTRSSWSLAGALAALAFAAQLHLAAGILFVVWLAVALAGIRSVRWVPLALSVGIILLVLAPYIYLQTLSGWSDLSGIGRFLQEPKHTDVQAIDTVITLAGADFYRRSTLPIGENAQMFDHDAATWLLAVLALGGLVRTVWSRRSGSLIAAAWVAAPVLFSLRHTISVEPHYLLAVLPALAVLQGTALGGVGARWATGLATLAIVAWQLTGYAGFQARVAETGPSTAYGMPLRYELEIANRARGAQQGNGTMYVANTDDGGGAFDYLLGEVAPIKRFDSRYTFVFPRASAWYVVQADGHAYRFLVQQLGAPAATVRSSTGKPVFGLFHVPADAFDRFETSARLAPLNADMGHAVSLVGYSAPHLAAGEASTVQVEWKVRQADAKTAQDLRQFGHLTDSSGVTWSTNEDFRGFPRSEWSPGDIALSWFDLAIRPDAPRGGYWFESGFYQPVSNQRLPVFNGERQIGSEIRVGPLKVAGQAPPAPANPRPLAVWEGGIGLLGGRWQGQDVALDWYAMAKPARDYTVFVHVLGSSGTLVAQHDGPPMNGTYPTSLWDSGELIHDVHRVAMAPKPGSRIEIGLYSQPDLRRLPVRIGTAAGPQEGDALVLTVSEDGTLILPPK